MKAQYRDYLLKILQPALRLATRSDFSANTPTIQGAAEYFVLSCPDGSSKLLYIGPFPHVIGQVLTQKQINEAGKREMSSATPSNMSLQEIIRLRQTRRPYGDMFV